MNDNNNNNVAENVQIGYRQGNEPVIYPDEYRHPNSQMKFGKEPMIVPLKYQQTMYNSKLKESTTQREGTRKYIRGSSYNNFEQKQPATKLSVRKGSMRKIKIHLANGDVTYVKIADLSGKKKLLKRMVKTCRSIFQDPRFANGHVRKGDLIGDLGRMATIGYNWNTHEDYPTIRSHDNLKDTNNAKQTRRLLGKMTPLLKKTMEDIFPNELDEIRRSEVAQQKHVHTVQEMCGFGSTAQCTENQGGASHIDLDNSRSVAVWLAGNTEEPPENWNFMFPFTEKDGKMVVVPLFHGCAISWDARVLQHCTSTTHNVGYKNNQAYAFMVGSSASKKGPIKSKKSRTRKIE